jgi:hypothetical protein
VGENIVANLSLYNPIDAKEPIPAVLDVPLEKPILDKCSNYKMTILRFNCPLYSIPRFLIKGQTLIVKYVRITRNNEEYIGSQTFIDPVNSINEFLSTINSTLINLWQANIVPDYNNPEYYAYPFFIYEPTTQLFSLIYYHKLRSVLQDGSPGFGLDIRISPSLYYYFAGMPAEKTSDGFYSFDTHESANLAARGFETRYYLCNYYRDYGVPTVNSNGLLYNAFKLTSEFPTDYRFNDFQSALVLSNIPVRQETIPQTTSQLSSNILNNLSYIATLPVLSDFRASVTRFGDQNSELIYFPPGEYRWIDLLSDGPLDRLSFDFRYQLIDQSIHQIMLNPGDSVSIKLYFKSIYK